LAQRSRAPYAVPAKLDGKIEDIDTKLNLMKIKYADGDIDLVPFGEQYSRNASTGFYNTNRMVINNFKIGDKFKKGDVLAYNKDAFKADPYSKQVDWKIGVMANMVLIECDDTLDDCSAMTHELAEKLGVIPVHSFMVTLTSNTAIHSYKHVGEEVDLREPVIIYDKSEVPDSLRSTDASVMDVLAKLNKVSEKSNHAGRIVNIDAFYTCPISEMSPSLQQLVKQCTVLQDAKADYAAGTKKQDNFVKSEPITTQYRVEGIVPEDNCIILRFFIQEDVDMDAGSKVVYSTELKSVVGYIIPECMDVEDGSIQADVLMSARAASARIVYSPFVTGAAYRVLDQLNDEAVKILFDE
jgi:hypothetical protein